MAELKNFYRVLGLDYGASAGAVENAYQIALELQPGPDADPIARDSFEAISRAYRVLSCESTRRVYDNMVVDDRQIRRRFPASAFRNNFAQATEEMNDLQKLHCAVINDLPAEISALIAKGVRPAGKTVKYVLDQDLPEIMKIFIAGGFKPSVSIINAAADASHGDNKRMLQEVLQAPDAALDERVLYHAVDRGRSDLAKIFIDKAIMPTPEMVHRAVHRYFEDPADRREAHMKVIIALTDGGAIPAKATIRYARREGYTDFVADALSEARRTNMKRGPKSKPFRFARPSF